MGLKLNIQKMKIMASGPIPSWQIDGETTETVRDFLLWSRRTIVKEEISEKNQGDASATHPVSDKVHVDAEDEETDFLKTISAM